MDESQDLEDALLFWNNFGNLSSEDVRRAVVFREICNAFANSLVYYYVFFEKTATSRNIPLGSRFYLSLDPAKYGIPEKHESKIVDELLEEVSANVNDLMEYDFDKMDLLLSIEIDKLDLNDSFRKIKQQEREFYRSLRESYRPIGNETHKGICSDAGNCIRGKLFELGLEERFGVIMISSTNNFTMHDTTLVFDKIKGNWSVVNSKSPVKNYNLVPKEKLVEIGRPYVF